MTNFFKQDTSDHATFRGSSSDFHADKETMLDTSGRCNVPWVQLRPTPPPVRRSIRNWLLFRFLNLPSSWQVLSKMPSSLLLVPPSWARAWWVGSTWGCFVCISGVFVLWYSKIDLRAPLGTLPLLRWCCRPAASFSTDLLSFKYAHHAWLFGGVRSLCLPVNPFLVVKSDSRHQQMTCWIMCKGDVVPEDVRRQRPPTGRRRTFDCAFWTDDRVVVVVVGRGGGREGRREGGEGSPRVTHSIWGTINILGAAAMFPQFSAFIAATFGGLALLGPPSPRPPMLF